MKKCRLEFWGWDLESSWFDECFSMCFIESAVSAAPKIDRLVREFIEC